MEAKRREWRSAWTKRGPPVLLCALVLLQVRDAAAAVGDVEAPARIEATYERLKLSIEARQRLDAVLRGREALLGYLPMSKLKEFVFLPQAIELRFDFGKKDKACVTIPAVKLWVLDATGRMLEVETEARDIVVHEHVRIDIGAKGALRIRKGDLEGKFGFFRPDLEVYTVRGPCRPVHDDQGRVLVLVDAEGRPRMQDGRPIKQTADEWLRIEAGGRTFEIALSGS